MSENIKAFCLAVITICVFVITILQLLTVANNPGSILPSYSGNNGTPNLTVNSNVTPTSVSFDEESFDFGSISEGDVVYHTFPFKNTGSAPLIIMDAHASCGCTVPSFPKTPIGPDDTSHIEVKFNSTGKGGLQDKTVTVTANTNPPQKILHIHANVTGKE